MLSSLLLLLTPCFLFLALQKWQLGFLHLVHNLPKLCMHVVVYSALGFLCVLLPKDTFVQVQAPQERVPHPRPQPQCHKRWS